MSGAYVYHFAHDQPDPPWHGPYTSHRAAVQAGQRDDGVGRVVYIKAAQVVGPGMWFDVGTERIEPASSIE